MRTSNPPVNSCEKLLQRGKRRKNETSTAPRRNRSSRRKTSIEQTHLAGAQSRWSTTKRRGGAKHRRLSPRSSRGTRLWLSAVSSEP